MELDKAFQLAVILSWGDLMKVSEPSLVRVEYLGEPGTPVDDLTVWSVQSRGHYYLVCDYWTGTSPTHPSGTRFRNGHCSDKLAESLDFIMKNQDQFTRAADACRHGMVPVHAPDGDDRTEAANWVRNRERGQARVEQTLEMHGNIKTGTILIKEGTPFPRALQFESEPCSPKWRQVKNLDVYGLARRIQQAGWIFFCLPSETEATVFGIDGENMVHRAIERILANPKTAKFNSLEIMRVAPAASKRFLGVRYMTVSARSRHIQESGFLVGAWDS
jgi:hypothetical protein